MSKLPTLPAAPAEVPVQSDLSVLAPFFREAVERVVADMTAWGYTPQVFETMRTEERQAFLYGFGRTYDDGRGVVTHSQSADDTWHGYGLAVDIICARRHGLVWGGDWNSNWSINDESFSDRPHIQWGATRRSPSAKAVELRAKGGLIAVWSAVAAM